MYLDAWLIVVVFFFSLNIVHIHAVMPSLCSKIVQTLLELKFHLLGAERERRFLQIYSVFAALRTL